MIESSTRRLALLRIVARAAKQKNGGDHGVTPSELQLAWVRTCLRRSDLSLTLREMQFQKLLIAYQSRTGPRFKLTPAGLRELRTPQPDLRTRLRDLMVLHWRRCWKCMRTSAETFRLRRVTDELET